MRFLCALFTLCLAVSAFSADTKDIVVANPPSVSPYAPTRIVLDGSKGGKDCATEARQLQEELKSLPYPPGWTLAIMCRQVRWEQILQQADVHTTHAAFTRIAERLTIFNADIFHQSPAFYRQVIAHELGHIKCNCASETNAEKIGQQLQRERSAVVVPPDQPTHQQSEANASSTAPLKSAETAQ